MSRCRTSAFSLIELVIVVVIIGIISAIAIPRLSRGSAGAADNALRGNLAVLRSAIELFAAEHDGVYPDPTTFEAQMTMKTNVQGVPDVGETGAAEFLYGPYLREIPKLPVGVNKGFNGVSDTDGPSIGWLYDPDTHEIRANAEATEKDAAGVLYTDY